MITDKLIWKKIYETIKYSSFDFITITEEKDDIWLFDKKKGILKRVILAKQTAQSTLFMVQKLMDHEQEIVSLVGQRIKGFEIVLVDQEVMLNELPRNIKIISCPDLKALDNALKTPYRVITNKSKPQSVSWYQRRVIKDNPIDIAMLKFAPMTYLFIIINIVAFIIMNIWHMSHKVDMLVEKGGLTHFNFVHGDYYRVLTSMFLHFDFQHLLFNMMSLFILGKLIEYLYHRWEYLFIYIAGGIFGNLVSLTFDTTSISVGASGAICALLGALMISIFIRRKLDYKSMLQIFLGSIVYLLISGLFANVNHFAHFGGLFGGILLSLMIYMFRIKHAYAKWMTLGVLVITILLLFNIFSEEEHHIYNEYAAKALAAGDDQSAKEILSTTVNRGYENDETYVYFGLLKSKQESLSDGIAIWKKGLKVYPDSEKLNYQMALAMRALDDYGAAYQYITKAIKINQKQDYLQLRKEINEFR
ncbi:rhomboid family intramembrane serine protease [Macrococcoides caseolyticum]|uniref:rhomboid family intramembrane serine protease n=1 Tax=Macrococcoides caseolyticum TaxID=69966 RepID=UPI001F1D471B|nr:rhomboid family intramembrane serine protease [Macrococcus caseolyticus]MCE4956116.1 rhomboid family intramembrane serine protease [Macrococcus caseolyticus]